MVIQYLLRKKGFIESIIHICKIETFGFKLAGNLASGLALKNQVNCDKKKKISTFIDSITFFLYLILVTRGSQWILITLMHSSNIALNSKFADMSQIIGLRFEYI